MPIQDVQFNGQVDIPAPIDGKDGVDGDDGKSAYQIWLELGNTGTPQDFINSLKGPKGDPGTGTGGGYQPIDVPFEALVSGFSYDGSNMDTKAQQAIDKANAEGLNVTARGIFATASPLFYGGQIIKGIGVERSGIRQLNANSAIWDGKGVLTHKSFVDGNQTTAFELRDMSIVGGKGRFGNGVVGAETEGRYYRLFNYDFGPTAQDNSMTDLNGHAFFPSVGARTITAPAMGFHHLRAARCYNSVMKLDVGNAQLTDWKLDRFISAGQGPGPFAAHDFDFGGAGGATIRHLKSNGRARGSAIRIRGILETTLYDVHVDGWGVGASASLPGHCVQIDAMRGTGGFVWFGGVPQFRANNQYVTPLYINPAITCPLTIVGVNTVQETAANGKIRVPAQTEFVGAFTNYGPGIQRG